MNLQLFPSDFSYTVESTGGLSDFLFMLSVSVCTQHLLLLLLLPPEQQQTHEKHPVPQNLQTSKSTEKKAHQETLTTTIPELLKTAKRVVQH